MEIAQDDFEIVETDNSEEVDAMQSTQGSPGGAILEGISWVYME
jgi:hypothetical protein